MAQSKNQELQTPPAAAGRPGRRKLAQILSDGSVWLTSFGVCQLSGSVNMSSDRTDVMKASKEEAIANGMRCASIACLVFGMLTGFISPMSICLITTGSMILCCASPGIDGMKRQAGSAKCCAVTGVVFTGLSMVSTIALGALFITQTNLFCSVLTASGRRLGMEPARQFRRPHLGKLGMEPLPEFHWPDKDCGPGATIKARSRGAECGRALLTIDSDYWSITAASTPTSCEISSDGACVTDGPGDYGADEGCAFHPKVDMFVTTTHLESEYEYDYLVYPKDENGDKFLYDGGTVAPPVDFPVVAGNQSTFVWYTDDSLHYAGFTICGSTTTGTYEYDPSNIAGWVSSVCNAYIKTYGGVIIGVGLVLDVRHSRHHLLRHQV